MDCQRHGNDPGGARRSTRRQVLTALGLAGFGAAGLGIARALGLGARPTPTTRPRVIARPTPTAMATPAPLETLDTPVSLVFTGDIMLGRTVNYEMLRSSHDFPFTHTTDFLHGFDLTIGNLECVVSRLGTPEPKTYTVEADPLGFQRLVDAGFSVVSVANNHSGDYGKAAFADMLGHLPKYGITAIGGGMNEAEAHKPAYFTFGTTTIGLLAYCDIDPSYFAATATTPGHAWLDADAMAADVHAAHKQCDFLIVFTHWGTEYHSDQNSDQVDMAHLAIDRGASLVVGAHPHVIQPSEIYRGKLIVYSLGNFVFDYMTNPVTSHGHLLTLSIHRSRLLSWKLVDAYIGDWGEPALG